MYSRAGRHSLINDQALFIRLVAFTDILSPEERVEALVKDVVPAKAGVQCFTGSRLSPA
jgi:hypothetical protein